MAVLTNFGDNNTKANVGVVYMSKFDGSLGKKVVLADKDPDYKIDEIDRMLFHLSGKDELTGYKF